MKNVSNLIILKRETHYRRLTINQLLSACLALIILTNRFHCVARLFSNGSRMTSNVVKNRKVRQKAQQSVSLMFLSHLDIICELLLYRITTTWSPFVLYILYDKKKQLLIVVFTPFRIFFQIVTQSAILYLLAGGVVLRVILGNVMLWSVERSI